MTFGNLSRRRLIAGLGLLAALEGCTTSPNSRFFTLAPQPAAAAAAAGRAPATVAVKPVELAKYLDRPQIVRHSNAYELQISDLERWGEEMRDMVTRVLIENLSLRLPASQVVGASGSLTIRADATVEVDVSRFDTDQNGKVFLDARSAVQRAGRRPSSWSDRITVQPASPSVPDLVAAMSDALGQLSDHIAQVLAA
jgi:uncharacterized lipoprotein YmbA